MDIVPPLSSWTDTPTNSLFTFHETNHEPEDVGEFIYLNSNNGQEEY